jgi:hypothetical protein
MPLYICELCHFESSLKGNYISHLNTLKHRRNNGEIIRDKVINFKSEHKVSTNEHKCQKSEHKVSTNEHKMSTNEHKFPKNNKKTNKNSVCIVDLSQGIVEFSQKSKKICEKKTTIGYLKNISIQKKTVNSINPSSFFCEFCNKHFKTKPNLKRHKKLYCKKIKNETTETYTGKK